MIITAHQVSTHYQDMGKGDVIVLLHGWGCDWQIWGPLIPELTKQFRVITPDLPAFGKSATPKSVWDSHEYVIWLQSFLSEVVGETPYTLLGHSFGGKIASLYAAQRPTNLTRLVLVDASGLPDALSASARLQQTVLGLIPGIMKDVLPRSLRTRLLHKVGAATDYATSTPAQRLIMRKIVSEHIASHLAHIITPTLLIWGELDQDTPVHQAKQFADHINGAELAIIPGAGHFPFLEKTDVFLAMLKPFLE